MPQAEQPNGNGAATQDAAAAFGQTMREAEHYVKRQWQENPIGVAAVVAGLGLLLGVILGRSR